MNVEAIGLALISAVAGALLAWLVVKARYGQELATRGERLRLLELNQDGMRLELVQAQRTQQQLHEQLASLGASLQQQRLGSKRSVVRPKKKYRCCVK